ncbi:MAG: tRNA uridine-5-carboxymethylaminomethyl(34) synthesis GTPase MnmE [Kiritimatiellae bacterium]|nr:tRNA uridine-5-carboxymethylaminomethyl(34) synthesis GTPase MnmE [Kiritimatiellia bacterium]
MNEPETIAAISTAPGRAGVAVIRISGDEAFSIYTKLSGKIARPGKISKAKILGEDCVILAFQNPRSFTGEDVIEIQCHGGAIAPKRILEKCFALGARCAGRGEFSRRAFLNGKISLEEAKGILELIDAKTERAAKSALLGINNRHSQALSAIYEATLEISSSLEHALDMDEGELPEEFFSQIKGKTAEAIDLIENEIRAIKEGKILREGALVVLAGAPNAGKSSLMNALLGESRAIVSSTAGTTRDSIEEWLDINGWPIRLVDTAGLRSTTDEIEAEGVERASSLIKQADIVISLSSFDTANQASSNIIANSPKAKIIDVTAKCDLKRGGNLNISSRTGEGLPELKKTISQALEDLVSSNTVATSNEDDKEGKLAPLNLALELLKNSKSAPDLTIAANEVRRASSLLGNLTGAEYSQDLLDKIFSRFCVGK